MRWPMVSRSRLASRSSREGAPGIMVMRDFGMFMFGMMMMIETETETVLQQQ